MLPPSTVSVVDERDDTLATPTVTQLNIVIAVTATPAVVTWTDIGPAVGAVGVKQRIEVYVKDDISQRPSPSVTMEFLSNPEMQKQVGKPRDGGKTVF